MAATAPVHASTDGGTAPVVVDFRLGMTPNSYPFGTDLSVQSGIFFSLKNKTKRCALNTGEKSSMHYLYVI